ncbi:uncharacterized protein N7459_002825 [Penicillium hispanicum]|uniref:uncharacterized protein n=1 Tax=Penicillium hispanicum TaxID=1080232 RepID=UPI00254245E3|nr:uncharacterized protein N7459_002825 [Penicillium hispanicum]KAJ5587060.1 hypothetical protein N7459_002825 [Penicillium hispanicum]
MDAKPQRIRVRGDENVPPSSFHANKAIHQRNKSTPALNVLAQGAKNGTRRAFGDVSNTKDVVRSSRDDSALVGKPTLQVVDNKAPLSQPAQRPMSVSGLKGLLNNVTAKPMNPAGKAQPASKSTKRSNVVYRDQLQPVAERESSKEANHVRSAPHTGLPQETVSGNVKNIEKEGKLTTAVTHGPIVDNLGCELVVAESDITLSDTEESKAKAPAKHAVPVTSDPEEYWDEDEENDSYLALGFPFRADNTTGGTITVIFPRITVGTKREILRAKSIVEAAQTEEEIMEDFYDSSMVAEYTSEIFLHLRTKELVMLPFADYMANQAEIQWSMRSVLMDWLVQVHFRFALLPETLFLCVNYIDRFLSHKVVSLGKLQLVGATALLIAAKFEEITAPSIHEIIYMVDGGYNMDEILKAERFMLTILNFDLGWPGPMSFLRRISKADDYDLETRTVAKYFLELTIMDERFVCTPPSFAAAGAHCLARLMLQKGFWTPDHAYYSGYLYQQLIPVMTTMLECCENPQRHHQAIYDKYLDRRFKRASLYVEAEVQRGFTLPDPSPLDNDDRLDGYANY